MARMHCPAAASFGPSSRRTLTPACSLQPKAMFSHGAERCSWLLGSVTHNTAKQLERMPLSIKILPAAATTLCVLR